MRKTALIFLAVLLLVPVAAAASPTEDLLSLIAMPLAVAAVSDLAGVPMNQLADVAATLNNALVPPVQFVQVMRYVPVALVTPPPPQQPAFVEFVDSRYDDGLTGTALVTAIDRQFPVYGVTPNIVTVESTRLVPVPVDSNEFFPPIVRTRVAEFSGHPHGGPPGQIKKRIGVQTGAEVVHGYKPGRGPHRERVYESPRIEREHVARGHGRAKHEERVRPMISSAPPGQMKKHGGPPAGGPPAGGPPGQAKKGGGHGHGKH